MVDAQQAQQNVKRILLTGFMGAGKTTVGILLAERLGWRFLDLDQHLEAQHGRTIAEIFTQLGEPHFRALESDSLTNILSAQSIVIALGGGALDSPANRAAISQSEGTELVFLSAPLDALMQRIDLQPNPSPRPKLANRESTAALHAARLPSYRTSSLHIDTTSLPPHEVAETILQQLHLHTLGTGAGAPSLRTKDGTETAGSISPRNSTDTPSMTAEDEQPGRRNA